MAVDSAPRCVSLGSAGFKCASFSCLRSKSVRVNAAPQEHTNGFSLVSIALSSQHALQVMKSSYAYGSDNAAAGALAA